VSKQLGLRTGVSTGACAAAAAKGAALLLLGREPAEVTLRLPWGLPAAAAVPFPLVNRGQTGAEAKCGVIKDSGDPRDVTDGIEVRAAATWEGKSPARAPLAKAGVVTVVVEGGMGVGRVTKAGLALPVGEAAINPAARAMIEAAVREALTEAGCAGAGTLRVEVRLPRGEEVARRTLDARLGILGGLSILEPAGSALPGPADAWRATLDAALEVARSAGVPLVVLSHGLASERAARALFPELPPEAFVLMGDQAGYALDAATARGLAVVLAGQFAKFCKVASGAFEPRGRDSTLDRGLLRDLLGEAGLPEAAGAATLAAESTQEVFRGWLSGGDRGAFAALARRVAVQAAKRVDRRIPVAAVLFGYDKVLLARSGTQP